MFHADLVNAKTKNLTSSLRKITSDVFYLYNKVSINKVVVEFKGTF